MPESYSIKLINRGGLMKHFILIQAPVTESGKSESNVFSNVFQASPPISPGGPGREEYTTFVIENEWFVFLEGTRKGELKPGEVVRAAVHRSATLGKDGEPGDSLTIDYDTRQGSPKFQDNKREKMSPSGAISIRTTANIPDPNEVHIAMGIGGKYLNKIIPTATIRAEAAKTYNIYPRLKFYVITSNHPQGLDPGMMVDKSQFDQTGAFLIDFEDPVHNGSTDVTYVFDSMGQFILYKG